jgi:hypothetical protein
METTAALSINENGRHSLESLPVSGPVSSLEAVPEPEMVARATRRRFTQEYKNSIILQADACTDRGALGALLRREGLYHSHLGDFRKCE